MSSAIPVGISACLLGQAVRFDGGHRRFAFAADTGRHFFIFCRCVLRWGSGYRRRALRCA